MSGDTTVTKTHGRKSVGGINRMVMDAQYFGKKLDKEAKVRCEQWTSIIKECLASGMPKTTWCREHGISDKSFFYWQRILREEAYLTTLESTLTPAVKRIQLQQLQILLKSK